MYVYLITYRTSDGIDHKKTVATDHAHPGESIKETQDRAKMMLNNIAKRPDVIFTKITQSLVPGI